VSSGSFINEYFPLLIKYKDGKDITEKEDLAKIEVLASIGLIKKGVSIERHARTAKTTSTGLGFIPD